MLVLPNVPLSGIPLASGTTSMSRNTQKTESRTIVETIDVAGSQVIDHVNQLVRAGNVRHLKVHAKDSDFSLEMPMTVGVLVGGAVVLTAAWLAMLGVIAGLMTKVQIEVERDTPTSDPNAIAPDVAKD